MKAQNPDFSHSNNLSGVNRRPLDLAFNPLAPRDVSGRTYFFAVFFLSTDFKEIKMPNLSIQPYKIGLEQ